MKVKTGQLLDEVREGVILQQVNAQGVMASGFAKAIRDKWPVVWEDYSKAIPKGDNFCHDSGYKYLGDVIWTRVGPRLKVASIVGQQFYGREEGRRYTSYDALDKGLAVVANHCNSLDTPFHFPTIGCGLGGGVWEIVEAIIEHHLGERSKTLWYQSR